MFYIVWQQQHIYCMRQQNVTWIDEINCSCINVKKKKKKLNTTKNKKPYLKKCFPFPLELPVSGLLFSYIYFPFNAQLTPLMPVCVSFTWTGRLTKVLR